MNITELKKRKKSNVTQTVTTGNIPYNIKQFNKHMGTDSNNPSTAEAQKAAKAAAKEVGTIAAASPDGANTIITSNEGGTMSENLKLTESSIVKKSMELSPDKHLRWGWDKGDIFWVEQISKMPDSELFKTDFRKIYSSEDAAEKAFNKYAKRLKESIALKEDKMYAARFDQTFDLPDDIHIIDKNTIEDELEKLEPEEIFEVGYITPIYFYADLWDKFTLLKCTQLKGYTGVDYIEARANDDANKQARIDISKQNIANGSGIHLNRQPLAGKIGDFSADYASTNKTVYRKSILTDDYNTLLFYPEVGSRPTVKYYIDLHNGMGYLPVRRDQLERTIIKKVSEFADQLASWTTKDGKLKTQKRRWTEAQLADKIRKQIAADAATINSVTLDATKSIETRSRISGTEKNTTVEKPQVRALYTNQIYFLKTPYRQIGQMITESLKLQEDKRYVRRYYIRPQNVFCSNKQDILQALIQFADQNCTIYTLNNLGDEKDVTKLTNNDIIYYYDDGILFDKNHIRIMDYDLYIKHEEERKKIDPETVSDATFINVYQDRITDSTRTDEAFNLDFVDVNAYGEILTEGKVINLTCCICGEPIEGYGNNPEPYMSAEHGEKCCDSCNIHYVIPARLDQLDTNEEVSLKDR